MNCNEFCKNLIRTSCTQLIEPYSVVCFTGKQYPLLFFSFLWHYVKKQEQLMVDYRTIVTHQYVHIIAQLQTTFLGMSRYYWLADSMTYNRSDYNALMLFLQHYTGPNKVLLFTSDATQLKKYKHNLIVELPDILNVDIAQTIATLFVGENKTLDTLMRILFKKNKTLPLDTLCLLLHYAPLLGSSTRQFCDTWLDMIVMPQQSLFSLSQYFFAKQPQQFFTCWSTVAQLYSPQFWSVFWSEQLWRAYHYIYFMEKQDIKKARMIGYRLPFSFLRRDWRLLAPLQLQCAHNQLYNIDFSLKNGGDPGIFDLFYSQFFLGT